MRMEIRNMKENVKMIKEMVKELNIMRMEIRDMKENVKMIKEMVKE